MIHGKSWQSRPAFQIQRCPYWPIREQTPKHRSVTSSWKKSEHAATRERELSLAWVLLRESIACMTRRTIRLYIYSRRLVVRWKVGVLIAGQSKRVIRVYGCAWKIDAATGLREPECLRGGAFRALIFYAPVCAPSLFDICCSTDGAFIIKSVTYI